MPHDGLTSLGAAVQSYQKQVRRLKKRLVAADELRRLMVRRMERIDHNVRICLCETCLVIQWFDATRKGDTDA